MKRRKKEAGASAPAFRYVGDPRHDFDGPAVLSVHGLAFPKGETVTVEDQAVARRLANNSHFEKV